MARKRIPLRTVKANANAAALEARQLIAQSSGTVQRLETKTLDVLTNLLEAVAAITELIADVQDGVTVEMVIGGKTMPVKIRIVPAEE
jgi:hypothetical protein